MSAGGEQNQKKKRSLYRPHKLLTQRRSRMFANGTAPRDSCPSSMMLSSDATAFWVNGCIPRRPRCQTSAPAGSQRLSA